MTGRLYILLNQCFVGLRVQEVNPNSGDVIALQYEDNYITLPQEVFIKPGTC